MRLGTAGLGMARLGVAKQGKVLMTNIYDCAEARGRKAAQQARERGASELEVALAQIRATFDNELRADTLAALRLSSIIVSGRAPTMAEVNDVLNAAAPGVARQGPARPGKAR